MATSAWERWPGETPHSFAAFCIYRDMGPDRTLERAAGQFYKSNQSGPTRSQVEQLQRWSVKNRWGLRCQIYDLEQQRQQQEIATLSREIVGYLL
jgi:hypothetical protein